MNFIFIYKGKLPSKANYKEIGYRRVGKEIKPFIRNKKEVILFQNEAIYQLHKQMLSYGYEKFPIMGFLKSDIVFFIKNNFEKRDLDNLEKFLFDVLEKGNIILNDAQIVLKNTRKLKFEEEGFLVKLQKISKEKKGKRLEKFINIFKAFSGK